MMAAKNTDAKAHDEIMTILNSHTRSLNDIKLELAGRKHNDDTLQKMKEIITGNGKPGFAQIRDKVLRGENLQYAIIAAIVIDMVSRFF